MIHKMKLHSLLLCCFVLFGKLAVSSPTEPRPVKEYSLTIRMEIVHPAGKDVMGMTVNGSIPGPTLRFTEGDSAVIHVTNAMDMETSVHWHGLLLPNFQDGVPYLTTPPIKPGETFTYHFPLIQAGTYWYHSHTMLQEQSGVYGSIVIETKKPSPDYETDLVLVISDWTNEKPMSVLRNLRRGNEWYGVKKGTSTPLAKVIGEGAFGAQLNFWRQRMEGADLADVYYNAFLINGEQAPHYPDLKPGERVRLRVINASASSQYWLTFGGPPPMLIAADGPDVVPVPHAKTFIAIAETYDFIVTIPQSGQIELKASVQDGSGSVSALLGNGPVLAAAAVPKPDQVKLMEQMAGMKMRMGARP
jgi:FtsP/CotA-like multicopper oxidase with cupredoxin domain